MSGSSALLVAAAAIALAGGGGFMVGRVVATVEMPKAQPPLADRAVAPPAAPFAALAAALAELPLPQLEAGTLLEWRGAVAAAEEAFARHGLTPDRVEAAASAAGGASAADLAALLDARAFLAMAADLPDERSALLQLARRIDVDATRDSIRAPLLANDADAVRIVAAGLKVAELPPRTATLLGAALLLLGDVDEALDAWREAATEHPEDPVVHLLLGWRLPTLPPAADEARRHLEAARALLPRSGAVKRRLEAMR